MRIYLKISYNGSKYNGFQKQNDGSAVQNVIEEVLSTFFNKDIKTQGASRTDTGVHAFAQVVTFDIENVTIPADRYSKILNQKLPKDIVVVESKEVREDFHPRYSCVKKTYIYQIYNDEYMPPIYNDFMVNIKKKLDFEKMNEACKYLIGEHDFVGFSNKSDNNLKSTVREIYDAKITKIDKVITFEITGNGFLYNMVRIIVGTLIDIGLGKKEENVILEVINSKDRKVASQTAKAQGLTLKEIFHTH